MCTLSRLLDRPVSFRTHLGRRVHLLNPIQERQCHQQTKRIARADVMHLIVPRAIPLLTLLNTPLDRKRQTGAPFLVVRSDQ